MSLILCYPCKEMRAPVEMVGDECYICVLKRGIPSGYFGRCVYRKAVAIALALATPLTVRQARRVARKVWKQYRNKDLAMRVLTGIRDCKTVPMDAGADFYRRVMEVLR